MEPSVCISADEADFEIQNSALPDYGQYTTVYPNTPIYATKTTPSSNQVAAMAAAATVAVNRMGSQCSYRTEHSASSKMIGSQSNLTSSVQELNSAIGVGVGVTGGEQATIMPTLRYIQPTHYEEMSEYGLNSVMPFANDGSGSQYAEDSPVAYGYVSEANYVLPALGSVVGAAGVGGKVNAVGAANAATYATRAALYDDNRNNSEAVTAMGGLAPQAFEDPHDFQNKMSQLTINSFGVVSQHLRNGGKDELAAVDSSCSDICSTMRWRDPNLSEVISFLNNPNNAIKANAAAYLQHLCYMDDPIKQRTRILGGIPPLIRLLSYEAPEIYK